MRFDESPLRVIRESRQACDMACVHCRATAYQPCVKTAGVCQEA